jgi:hypothetical protein
MDDYPYATLGADGWFHSDRLHHQGFPTLLWAGPRQHRYHIAPIRNEGNAVWSEHVAAVGDPKLSTHHAGGALTTHYNQHVSSLLQEATTMGTHLRLRLEEYTSLVKA